VFCFSTESRTEKVEKAFPSPAVVAARKQARGSPTATTIPPALCIKIYKQKWLKFFLLLFFNFIFFKEDK
jgi:hypothetical protein